MTEPNTSGQYPDPEAIRQKRIAELERLIKEADGYAAMYSNRRDFWVNLSYQHRAELSRLRNEEPKGGEVVATSIGELEALLNSEDSENCMILPNGQVIRESHPEWKDFAPSPSPEPQDVRAALEKAAQIGAQIAELQAAKEAAKSNSEYIKPGTNGYNEVARCEAEIKKLQEQLYALSALAQSDAQPVGWQYRGVHRTPNHEAVSSWVSCTHEEAEFRKREFPDTCEVRPLYTAPPSPDASGLIEAAKFVKEQYGATVATIFSSDDTLVEVSDLGNGNFSLIVHNRRHESDTWDDLSATLQAKHFAKLGSIVRRSCAADRSAPRSDKGEA